MLAWLEADLDGAQYSRGVGGCGVLASYHLANVHSGRRQAAATTLQPSLAPP